jgi:hypothetical protein
LTINFWRALNDAQSQTFKHLIVADLALTRPLSRMIRNQNPMTVLREQTNMLLQLGVVH